MIAVAGLLLALGVGGLVYAFIGRFVAQDPPTGHSAGASRARALVQMSPMMIRVGAASLALGAILLVMGLA